MTLSVGIPYSFRRNCRYDDGLWYGVCDSFILDDVGIVLW